MKRSALFFALVIALVLIGGCSAVNSLHAPSFGGGSAQSTTASSNRDALNSGGIAPDLPPMPAAAPTAAPAQPAPAAITDEGKFGADTGIPSVVVQQAEQRMVVYNGTIKLEVQDTEQTVAKIADILKTNQGYISNRSLDRDSQGKVSGSITIRVPAAALDATLTQIRALGLKVLHEDASSQDVTQQYIDLDARRKNLETYEVELQKLMDTMRESTTKASDLLAVYNQLTEVRGQIEQIKGQQNYLQNTSTLATYTIALVPHEEVVINEPGTWDPGTTARQALHALVQSLQGLADIGINLILFVLPVLLILALPFALLFWIGRRMWRRRTPHTAATA